jgi:hypothetical protein
VRYNTHCKGNVSIYSEKGRIYSAAVTTLYIILVVFPHKNHTTNSLVSGTHKKQKKKILKNETILQLHQL